MFVYGTLLNDEVLEIILGRRPVKRSASLQGYKRVKVSGQRYPAILPDENSKVDGAILTGLSDSDLKHLDEYEGREYEKVAVVVVAGDVSQRCMTYMFRPEYNDLLSNEAWSNESFRKNYLQRFLKEFKD